MQASDLLHQQLLHTLRKVTVFLFFSTTLHTCNEEAVAVFKRRHITADESECERRASEIINEVKMQIFKAKEAKRKNSTREIFSNLSLMKIHLVGLVTART
jgi:hypothetical protein